MTLGRSNLGERGVGVKGCTSWRVVFVMGLRASLATAQSKFTPQVTPGQNGLTPPSRALETAE